MRRNDREVTEKSELMQIIDQCLVCRIAMQDKEGLYIVPMNFGYVYQNDQLVLFFHCASEGRKLEAFKKNNNICFEMDCEHKLITGNIACQYGFSYKSIIGNGNVVFVEDVEEKKGALSVLMKHQSGQEFEFNESMVNSVTVFKIMVKNYTGKYHN